MTLLSCKGGSLDTGLIHQQRSFHYLRNLLTTRMWTLDLEKTINRGLYQKTPEHLKKAIIKKQRKGPLLWKEWEGVGLWSIGHLSQLICTHLSLAVEKKNKWIVRLCVRRVTTFLSLNVLARTNNEARKVIHDANIKVLSCSFFLYQRDFCLFCLSGFLGIWGGTYWGSFELTFITCPHFPIWRSPTRGLT